MVRVQGSTRYGGSEARGYLAQGADADRQGGHKEGVCVLVGGAWAVQQDATLLREQMVVSSVKCK